MKFYHELFDQAFNTNPDKIFIYGHNETITYNDLNCSIESIKNKLLSLNLPPGQRIMIVGENSKEFIASALAISKVGGVSCALSSRLTTQEISKYVKKFSPSAIIFTNDKHIGSFDVEQFENIYIARYNNLNKPVPDAAVVLFSSGTTGEPKGIVNSHTGLLKGAHDAVKTRGFVSSDKFYAHVPLSHGLGLSSVLCAALKSGASIIMRDRFDPKDVFDALENHGASTLQGPPTMYVKLLEWLDANNIDYPKCPNLRYLYAGSAPLSLKLKERVEEKFKTVLHNGYGVTEHGGIMFITKLGVQRSDTSVGYPVENLECRVSTDQNSPSEVFVRAPGVMPGYLDDPDQTSAVLSSDGWLATGDIGYVDSTGALFLVARKKEVIKHSGFSVYPNEIENVINKFDGVELSAVVGKEDSNKDEQIIAFIKMETNKKLNTDDLNQYLKQQLATYKMPSEYRQVDDFVLTNNGKIIKNKLPV